MDSYIKNSSLYGPWIYVDMSPPISCEFHATNCEPAAVDGARAPFAFLSYAGHVLLIQFSMRVFSSTNRP